MKQNNTIPDNLLIEIEMSANGVVKQDDGMFLLDAGGEDLVCDFPECLNICRNELSGLKQELWDAWEMVGHIADVAVRETRYNESSCLDNLLFLNNVKKTYLFSRLFDELSKTSQCIKRVFSSDISHIDEDIVKQFNELSIGVKVLHALVMKETYRCKLLQRFGTLNKMAAISGPWANLDLPMLERVYPYDNQSENEEYMQSRTDSKQKQTRYNPEYSPNMYGVYYFWPEEGSRNPYRFEDRKTESPYKSRNQISIP